MNARLTRRDVLKTMGIGTAAMVFRIPAFADSQITHIVTLSFDDGFEKSSIKTAEIFEKYGLLACINVIATAHLKNFNLPNEYHAWKVGDFQLWNDLQKRGHEIMPHSYDHSNLAEMPAAEAKESVLKCLEVFNKELNGFNAKNAVYNFAYNASTPEIEEWLGTQVMAYRTGGPLVNPLPYPGQTKLTCISHGPENIDKHLGDSIDEFLKLPQGWFIYNTHGLDDEGWGPVSSGYLDELLDKLSHMRNVSILPAAKALQTIK